MGTGLQTFVWNGRLSALGGFKFQVPGFSACFCASVHMGLCKMAHTLNPKPETLSAKPPRELRFSLDFAWLAFFGWSILGLES